MSLSRIFYLTFTYSYCWSYDDKIQQDFTHEEYCISRPTINNWFNCCRETVVIYQINNHSYIEKIGGPGKIVQIDESKFGKPKYNKGRHIEGHLVLGMIEDKKDNLRLEICPANIRSTEVLLPLSKQHVCAGPIVHTDYWRAYDCLSDNGYIHHKVNHSYPENAFVTSEGIHTQRIESEWSVEKKS